MPDAHYGDSVEVTLSGFEGAPAPSAASFQQSELEALFERIRVAQSELNAQDKPAQQQSDLAALFAEIDREHTPTLGNGAGQSRTIAAGRKGTGADRAGVESQGEDAQAAARTGGRSHEISSGDLWAQIEPCWRRMPENSAVPVTLEVVINGRGDLASPPRVIRPMAAALTDQRLIAEARAVEAVAACAPLRTPIAGREQTFRLVFIPTRRSGGRRRPAATQSSE